AFAARGPAGNLARFAGSGDVIDADPSKEVGRHGIAICAVDLVIDDHQTIGDSYLVRMGAGGHADVGELPAMLWIPHINNGRTGGAQHMPDIGDAIGRDDLPTAGAIKVPDLANANSTAHERPPASRSAAHQSTARRRRPLSRFALSLPARAELSIASLRSVRS